VTREQTTGRSKRSKVGRAESVRGRVQTPRAGETGFTPPKHDAGEHAERGRVRELKKNRAQSFPATVYFLQREIVVHVRESEQERTEKHGALDADAAAAEKDGEYRAAENELLEKRREH
jgi:hypothetical protein